LPKGTFATATLADRAGFHRAVFMIPMAVAGFRRFVSKRWPAAGYVLGRMAVGGRHFSGSFVKQPARGTFLAQERCGGKESALFLGYAASPPSPSSS
jgi:hypothetical protein